MEKQNENNIKRCYELIISSLTETEDISEYTFQGIEKEIDKFINLLDDTDKMILTKRYGLKTGIPKTYDSLSNELSFNGKKYTNERISIMCTEALEHLRELIYLNSKSFVITKDSLIYKEKKITHEMLGSLNFSEACDNMKNIPDYKSKRTLFYLDLYDKLINKKLDNTLKKSRRLK